LKENLLGHSEFTGRTGALFENQLPVATILVPIAIGIRN
jgi:hypothetical protein